LTNNTLIERAFSLALDLHGKQYRKASIVPRAVYMSHLTEVAGMVWGCFAFDDSAAQTVVAAALLHDAIEDQPLEMPRSRIEGHCSREVRDLVEELTEKGSDRVEKAPWQERKQSYLSHISEMPVYALLISICDKLQSARELKRQVRRMEDEAYAKLGIGETLEDRRESFLWFHRELVDSYRAQLAVLGRDLNAPIIEAIDALIEEFAEVVIWLEEH
jgi:(p)ppGpp synthase/HD superfamily hydrolase